MKLIKSIQYLDLFAYKPSLLYNNKSYYSSLFSGCCSIILIGFCLLLIQYVFRNLLINGIKQRDVTRNNFYYSFNIFDSIDSNINSTASAKDYNTIENNYASLLNIFNDKILIMFKLNDRNANDNFQVIVNYEQMSNSGKDKTFKNLNYNKCNYTNFANYYCVEANLFKNTTHQNLIKIIINKTESDLEKGITQNQNNKNKSIPYLKVLYPLSILNPYTFDFASHSLNPYTIPMKYFFKEAIFPLDGKMKVNSNFSPTLYTVDQNTFFQDNSHYKFDYNLEYLLDSNIDNLNFQSNLSNTIELTIGLSDYFIIFDISCKKLFPKVFPVIYCLIQIVYVILCSITNLINQRLFYNDLIATLHKKEKLNNNNNSSGNDVKNIKEDEGDRSESMNANNQGMININQILNLDNNIKKIEVIKNEREAKEARESNLENSVKFNDSNMSLNNTIKNTIRKHNFNNNENIPQLNNNNLLTDLTTVIRRQGITQGPQSGSVTYKRGPFDINSQNNLKLSFAMSKDGESEKNSNSDKNEINVNIQHNILNKNPNKGVFIYKIKNPIIIQNKISWTKQIKDSSKKFMCFCKNIKYFFKCGKKINKNQSLIKTEEFVLKYSSIDEVLFKIQEIDKLINVYNEMKENDEKELYDN